MDPSLPPSPHPLWRNSTPRRVAVETRASRATRCLERAWAWLREADPRIPAAVLLVIDAPGRKKRLGHFAHSTWRYRDDQAAHEVGVSASLFESAESLLTALLHEAAHAVNHELRIRDCGPDGYYHRKEYRNTARSLGLDCGFVNGRYGWTATDLGPGAAAERYARIIAYLRRTVPWGSQAQTRIPWVDRTRPASGHVRLRCRCAPRARSIYVTRGVAEQGGLRCDFCRQPFASESARNTEAPRPQGR